MLFGHGDDTYLTNTEIIGNFSSNVWPGGPHPELINFLKTQLECIATYPEVKGESLAKALANFHGLKETQFLVCNGATEAFSLIAQTYARMHSCIFVPAFAEYEDACLLHKHLLSFEQRNSLKANMPLQSNLVWLGNPNNPDGYLNDARELRLLIAANPDRIFVIDEAYIQFSENGESLIKDVERFDNLIIIRSMTKYYAIPGLRLGYIAANEKLIARLETHKLPWTTNSLAVAAGKFLIENNTRLKPEMPKALSEAQEFFTELRSIEGLDIIPSATNYCLIRLPKALAAELKQFLIEEFGLLIRDASNFRTLDAYYFRVASQTPELNRTLINALKLWMQSIL